MFKALQFFTWKLPLDNMSSVGDYKTVAFGYVGYVDIS